MKYAILAVKVVLTLAFVAAGGAKIAGVDMMVGTFDAIGWGQWFRYVTGIIEVGAAALLWVPGLQWIGAALLTVTMVGAVIAHLAVLGPSLVPALVLGIFAAIVLWWHKDSAEAMIA